MRPQDIVVLLKLVSSGNQPMLLTNLSNSLLISLSEVSESLNRSQTANLLDYDKKNVLRQNLMEFLQYGVRYVFPQKPGTMTRGLPTAHAHPFMAQSFSGNIPYVWPDINGEEIGLEILPFYEKQAPAARQDEVLYKILALVDVLRVGKLREIKVAIHELKNMILHES